MEPVPLVLVPSRSLNSEDPRWLRQARGVQVRKRGRRWPDQSPKKDCAPAGKRKRPMDPESLICVARKDSRTGCPRGRV